MKLGSLKSPSRDGELIVVSRDLKWAVRGSHIAPSLREAVERWNEVVGSLQKLSDQLNDNAKSLPGVFAVKEEDLLSALPRTWLFADGSAFIHHIKLVRKARNAALPETLATRPLMYQAESGRFLSPTEPIPQIDFAHGTDFEAEVGVILQDTPMGVSPEVALQKIALLVLINDVSLRGLIPEELGQGFGFFQSKPTKSLSPFAITPDELGEEWQGGRVMLPLMIDYNGQSFGRVSAAEMHFHFGELVAHAAKTRDLVAGTLIGSGTVSNEDISKGSGCLVEKRTLEQINAGTATTPFMRIGDTIEIQMLDRQQKSLFGKISQRVQAAQAMSPLGGHPSEQKRP